jgi:1-deoxy-D-xylulose-5-phosphate reductoisomerase
MSRGITILGATGSVGQSTLDLIGRAPDDWHVHAVTANTDATGLAAIARACNAELAVVGDDGAYQDLKAALSGSGIAVASGKAALVEAAERPADIVMSAIVGAAGLAPTLAAVRRGAVIALANKESLVCAGDIVTAAARQSGARLLPVDSEHNAIYQIFDHDHPERVARVILTASGGPFRKASVEAMRAATPGQACNHPVWSMGAKISVDSATLMNKGLELIEAHHLFPVSADQLGVIVHPQSVVHSFVEYIDGSVLAQLGTPDMRTPIAYTLAHPERMATPCKRLNLAEIGKLEFEEPDLERFPALGLAWDALRTGGAMPTALNAANEVAVAAFLAGEIGFLDIAALVRDVLDALDGGVMTTLDDVMAVDAAARRAATQRLATLVPA